MICKECGTQISEEAKFCVNCGSVVETEVKAESAPEASAEETNPEKEKKTKKENKFLRGFVSVLCCIMIFVFSLSALTIFVARQTISDKRVEKILDEVDITAVMGEDEQNIIGGGISGKDMDEIYHETSIKDYVTDIATQYTGYLLGGDKPDGIDADDVIDVVQENWEEIYDISGKEMKERDYAKIQRYFGENGEENLGVLSEDVRTNSTLDTVRIVLSVYIIALLGLLALLFVFLMLKARRFRLDTMVWTSVPLIVTAVVLGIFGTVKPLVLMLVSPLGAEVGEVVNLVMSNILGAVLIDSLVVLLAGVLLIVIYSVIKKAKKSEKAKVTQ